MDSVGVTDAPGLAAVLRRSAAAARRAGRRDDEVTLVAVSKGRPVGEVLQVYQAGHRDFGENRPEELAKKAPQLPDDIRWHINQPWVNRADGKTYAWVFNSLHPSGAQFALCDGSVQFLQDTMNYLVLLRYAYIHDGEPLGQ